MMDNWRAWQKRLMAACEADDPILDEYFMKNPRWQFLHHGHAVDCILYHQFLYYVRNAPELKDVEYDQLEEAVRILYPGSPILSRVGSSNSADYPCYIRDLRRPNEHERKWRDEEFPERTNTLSKLLPAVALAAAFYLLNRKPNTPTK